MDHWVSQQIQVAEQDHFYYLRESMDIPKKHSDECPNCVPMLDTQGDHNSDAAIKFLNQILLEDNMDENDLSMSYDPIALRAAENSFYEALRQNPSSPYQGPLLFNNNSEGLHCTFGSSGDYSTTGSTISSFDTDQWIVNPVEPKSSLAGDPPSLLSSRLPNLEDYNTDFTRSKKHNLPDKSGLEEERSSKYSAVYEEEEVELSEMFDKLLICADSIIAHRFPSVVGGKGTPQNGRSGRKSRSKKQKDSIEFVDLETLLLSCARSIAAFNHGTAKEQLKNIRKYSSPTGDAYQRMAHAFANALEARLNGTGPQLSEGLTPPNKMTGVLKSVLISWPVIRISYFVANKIIQEVASKGTSLHVIDFGIFYGIQWPTLIRDLSKRPTGPPKLRITGIEYPVCGFRPEQMVVETGRRLAKYCEQFGVPFEYNAITSQSWEKIKIDELKLVKGEVVAVYCAFRLRNLMDETIGADKPSPRDAVLNLIREITPHVFVTNVLSASHSSPLFLSRFREAFLFYSNFFDMIDATVPCDDSRLRFEQEFPGREIMNVIACEGIDRVERPETYKQWQLRIMKAGFKPMPMNPDLVKKLRGKVKAGYHKEFVFDEDGHWLLQGWKGRTFCGISCWAPGHFTKST